MHEIDLLKIALNYTDTITLIGSTLRDNQGSVYDFRIQWASRTAEAITGQSVIVGQTIGEVLPAALWTSLKQQAVEVVSTGLPRRVEHQVSAESGAAHWYSVSMQSYEAGICLSFNDITIHKQAEQRLYKSIDELQRSNQNLEQFAYVASHDLQEPLRKLIGFGDILEHEYKRVLGEQGVRVLQRMQVATRRMHLLINDLLSFSRVSSTKEVFRRVDLQAVVNDVISDLEPLIHDRKAVLDITTLPYLEGNAGQLGQLFQNLLSNALKFTQPGSTPRIQVDCKVIRGSAIQAMPGTPVLAADLSRSFFAITVSDNGIGFDEKYLDRIFTIFQRLHSRDDYPGTGIGLAIVQKVIENHRGYLNAHSQPGQGAEFTVYLPNESASPGVRN